MRNNRLHIEYAGSSRNATLKAGKKESFKCGSLSRAKEILLGIDRTIIRNASYTNAMGLETKLVEEIVTNK